MKERVVSGLVLMLLLTSMLTSAFIIQPVEAELVSGGQVWAADNDGDGWIRADSPDDQIGVYWEVGADWTVYEKLLQVYADGVLTVDENLGAWGTGFTWGTTNDFGTYNEIHVWYLGKAEGYASYKFTLPKPAHEFPIYQFSVGDRVRTTANLNVRDGPGLGYGIIDTMAEGALGQILGGPVEADGYTWWNVSYDIGTIGWSAENWLEIYQPSVCGKPVLVTRLEISPKAGFRVGDTLTATFTIQNQGDAAITLDKLLLGGRFNGGTLSNGEFPDFTFQTVTLQPEQSHQYEGTLEPTEAGNYQFFIAYYMQNPNEEEKKLLDENNWNTCIDLAEGLTDNDRAFSLTCALGIVYIRADGSVDPPSAAIERDGDIYTFTGDIYDSIVVERDHITIDGNGYLLQGATGYGIDLSGRQYVTIKNTQIRFFDVGIRLLGSLVNSISGNNITNNSDGIYINDSSGSSVSGNNIAGNEAGITIDGSSKDNYVTSNNITANYNGAGIYIWLSTDNSITANNIANNFRGIHLWFSQDNSISGNNITTNSGSGISFYESSSNTIYHNSFVSNAQQVYHWPESVVVNVWDDGYPSGGNYWSDYTGVDADGDGIGDAPYVIDANNQDRYPLMNPWTPTPQTKFSIGDRVRTTANLNVREGPGLSYGIVDTVPEGALGQIMGGPAVADGYTWWNVDYDIGVGGWSAENWLEITSEPLGRGHPVLVSAMKISRIGDTLTAEFKIQNRGSASIKLDKLLVGGRFNWGALANGGFPDFPYESVTLAPNELHEYKAMMELTEVGNYQFFVAYYINDPSEQEKELLDENNWNTSIDLAEELTDKDRSVSLDKWPSIVISTPLAITPSGPFHTGDRLIARFGIKNKGAEPISLSVVTVGGRGPDGLPVDFDLASRTINPEDEYVYVGTIILPELEGSYHFFSAYQTSWGSWNPSIDLDVGLADEARVKDIGVLGTMYDYPLGGIVIPEADFPEGAGRVIPIYIPPVVDDSNIMRQEDTWQTVKTLTKADWSFDWPKFAAGLTASRAEVWDPFADDYVPSAEGSIFSLVAGALQAASGAQSVITIDITIQKNSGGSYRAIVQVGDPQRRSLFRANAVGGIVSIVPGQINDVRLEVGLSDALAQTFKLPKVEYHNVYLPTLLIDRAHENDECTGYLSLSKDNRIELTPKIYSGDAFIVNHWKYHWYFFPTLQEVVRLKGQGFVDLEQHRATDDASKLIQNALSPFALVPESAILLNGGSPCEFRIRDSQGRVTGLVNGETHEEIPYSMFLSESETIVVYDPSESLNYEVVGANVGTYHLYVTYVNGWNVTTFIASNIPITNQSTHQYTIDWDALSLGEEGVTVQVDSDGDDVFEHTFTSDGELTISEYVIGTDGTPPETWLNIDEPKFVVDSITYLTSATPIELIAEDNLGGSGVASTAYRIYNATYDSGWMTYTETFYLVGLGDGAYQIDYNSTDIAGNVELSNTPIVILDNTGPAITVENPPAGWALQDGVTFIISAMDASGTSSMNISIREADGDEGTPVGFEDLQATYDATTGKWTVFFDTLQLPDGYYTVLVKAEDNLGHASLTSVDYSIRNWAVLELLPATENNKAGRTMPVKFALRVAASVDPNQPFVYNEDLTIKIYATKDPSNILQTSTFGDTARDYRINTLSELYITNFQTLKTPMQYTVTIYRDTFLVGGFEFRTVK